VILGVDDEEQARPAAARNPLQERPIAFLVAQQIDVAPLRTVAESARQVL
jgi:hypothetical protein